MNDSVIIVHNTKHYLVIKKIITAVAFYLGIMLFLGLVNVYEFNKTHKMRLVIKNAKHTLRSSNNKLHKVRAINVAASKTQTLLQNVRVENYDFKRIKGVINELASRHRVVSRIEVNMAAPQRNRANGISSIDMEMFVKAGSDESIIKFVDSLVTSFAGFIKIDEMNLHEVQKNLVSCKLRASWYTLPNNKDQNQVKKRF